MNAKKCDRCGKFFDLYTVTNKMGCKFENGFNYLIQANACSEYVDCHKKVYELCLDCCESFNEWVENMPFSHSNNCAHCKYDSRSIDDDPCIDCNRAKYFEPKEVDT